MSGCRRGKGYKQPGTPSDLCVPEESLMVVLGRSLSLCRVAPLCAHEHMTTILEPQFSQFSEYQKTQVIQTGV